MAPDTTPEANRYRIQRLEQDVRDLQVKLDDYSALKQNVAGMTHEIEHLSGEFSGLRRALYTAALTIAGSTVLFAVSVLVAIMQ